MKKVRLGPKTTLFPMPAILVGANVNGKPNFMTAAWGCIASSKPAMFAVALQTHRYTYRGIKETGVFSINVPSTLLCVETDFCGLLSGEREDKVAACAFDVFYGILQTAPLIGQCPINFECKLVQTHHLGTHDLLIGEIMEVHASEDCLSEGEPDARKVDPLIYGTGAGKAYYALGKCLGAAFSIGRRIHE
jgi:flavin reductase (DIM6/NTAB) family NADH-FMN oxidoreductase RutF